jgi:hypothetical protein
MNQKLYLYIDISQSEAIDSISRYSLNESFRKAKFEEVAPKELVKEVKEVQVYFTDAWKLENPRISLYYPAFLITSRRVSSRISLQDLS